jgi:hypothetical protein
MIAHNNWADIPAGQLSDALVSLCALRVTDQRHYWIDKLEWDAHLRVNCLGDERYTKESRGRVRYLDGFWTDNECSSPVNLPGVESGGVASLCEVKQHRIIP